MDENQVVAERRRGRPPKNHPVVEVSSVSAEQLAAANNSPEALEKKLEHFQYTRDPNALEVWEASPEASPVAVPKEIRDAYPHLRFHWVSRSRVDKLGAGYGGWQMFRDGKHPNGVTRGNDLFLAAMPEELARKRDAFVIEQAKRSVRGMQERHVENLSRMDAKRDGIAPLTAADSAKSGWPAATGIQIGPRRVGGYDPEELREMIARAREERAKNRKYFT